MKWSSDDEHWCTADNSVDFHFHNDGDYRSDLFLLSHLICILDPHHLDDYNRSDAYSGIGYGCTFLQQDVHHRFSHSDSVDCHCNRSWHWVQAMESEEGGRGAPWNIYWHPWSKGNGLGTPSHVWIVVLKLYWSTREKEVNIWGMDKANEQIVREHEKDTTIEKPCKYKQRENSMGRQSTKLPSLIALWEVESSSARTRSDDCTAWLYSHLDRWESE